MIKGLILMVLTGNLVAEDFNYCPQFTTTGEPRFTKELAREDAVRMGRSRALLCCSAGIDDITWYRQAGHGWQKYPNDRSAGLEEHNQVLRIHEADSSDNTTFKCDLMKNGVSVKSNEIQLYVLICDKLAQGPILTEPWPADTYVDKFGGDLSFACTGYFGCDDNDAKQDRIVTWQVRGRWGNISKVDRRYTMKTRTFFGGTKLQANLTIKSVSQEDLSRTFVCQLASPQLIDGQTSLDIRIYKTDKPNLAEIIALCIGGAIGGILIIALLLLLLRYLYGPQIRVCMESRLKILAKKPISGEGMEHNAFIYHAPDDTSVAVEIKNRLEENNFIAKTSYDIPGDAFELRAVEEEIKKSAMVLFLYSQNLREDKLANVVVQSLIYESLEKSIIFIEIENFDPEEAMNWTKEAENNAEIIKLKLDANADNDIHTDGDTAPVRNKDAIVDLKFWKVLPRFKYPEEDASDRRKKNFWCSLRTKIPKFKHQFEVERRKSNSSMERLSKGRSSSSTKPLLESPAASPAFVDNAYCNENLSMSPASADRNVRFRYDEPFQGNGLAQCNNSDDSVMDKSTAVVVNVDVHRPGERHDDTLGTGKDRTDVITEAVPDAREHKVVIDADQEELPENDHRETGVFTLSGEESQPISNGIEKNFGISGLSRLDDERPLGQTNVQSNSPRIYKGQNGGLAVEISENRSGLCSSSSQESGYTSLSPERQQDVEPSFMLQHNVNNHINV